MNNIVFLSCRLHTSLLLLSSFIRSGRNGKKLEITPNMLSIYCSDIAIKYRIKIGGVNKLVPNSRNKKRYVDHYRNL